MSFLKPLCFFGQQLTQRVEWLTLLVLGFLFYLGLIPWKVLENIFYKLLDAHRC